MPSLEEMQADLANTIRDSEALQKIIEGYQTFIFQSGGEDRNSLRGDLYRAEGLKTQADKLIIRIRQAIEKVSSVKETAHA